MLGPAVLLFPVFSVSNNVVKCVQAVCGPESRSRIGVTSWRQVGGPAPLTTH